MVRPRPPISAATFAPTGNSPPGHESTMPTHSMPLTSAASAHSPRRMCSSAWLIPNPFTSITTSPSLGNGLGMSVYTRLSSPPNLSRMIARMLSPPGLSRTTAGAVGGTVDRGEPMVDITLPPPKSSAGLWISIREGRRWESQHVVFAQQNGPTNPLLWARKPKNVQGAWRRNWSAADVGVGPDLDRRLRARDAATNERT